MQIISDTLETFTSNHPAFQDEKPILRFHGFRSEGHLVDIKNPGIRTLSQAHQLLNNHEPEHYLSTCTTDLRAFHFYSRTAGTCYGPIAKRIHGIDECVDIASIKHTLKTYAVFLSKWCEISKT